MRRWGRFIRAPLISFQSKTPRVFGVRAEGTATAFYAWGYLYRSCLSVDVCPGAILALVTLCGLWKTMTTAWEWEYDSTDPRVFPQVVSRVVLTIKLN